MIIVRLTGGLGNQLFQYAFGRRQSIVNKTNLKLDLRDFEHNSKRSYELENLNIIEDFASSEKLPMFHNSNIRWWERASEKLKWLLKPVDKRIILIKEKHFHFDSNALCTPDNTYLDGYWQSERYFKEVEETIRKEFTVKAPLDAQNLKISKLINNTNSVSLHVRRGDYVSEPVTFQYHGVCSLNYYNDAIEMITHKLENPHFFIFSDDPKWAEQNIEMKYPREIINFNGSEKAHKDLRLMSLCKHQIIANSSFSWWGAWLNTNPGKIVIAPKRWFLKDSIDTRDLLPESWVKI